MSESKPKSEKQSQPQPKQPREEVMKAYEESVKERDAVYRKLANE